MFVPHRGMWPHEFVLSGQNKDRITYNQLSTIQWMAGFCRSIIEESEMSVKEHMLDYVIDLVTPQISPGLLQKLSMSSSSVGWSRERLSDGRILTR